MSTIYENAKHGYRITIPDGFQSADDDKAMEEMIGGKMFMGEYGMISITTEASEDMPAEEILAMMADDANVDADNGEKLISKDVQPGRIVLKFTTGDGICAQCMCGKGSAICTIAVQFDNAHEKEFNEQVDAMLDSMEFAEIAEPAQPEPLTYENAKHGYSVTLPAGFRPQNQDAEMEEMNGGKLFICRPNSINTSATTVADPKAYLAGQAECCKVDKDEELISKDVADDRITFKYKDSFGYYRTLYFQATATGMITLDFSYEDLQTFDEQVDKTIATLQIK